MAENGNAFVNKTERGSKLLPEMFNTYVCICIVQPKYNFVKQNQLILLRQTLCF